MGVQPGEFDRRASGGSSVLAMRIKRLDIDAFRSIQAAFYAAVKQAYPDLPEALLREAAEYGRGAVADFIEESDMEE